MSSLSSFVFTKESLVSLEICDTGSIEVSLRGEEPPPRYPDRLNSTSSLKASIPSSRRNLGNSNIYRCVRLYSLKTGPSTSIFVAHSSVSRRVLMSASIPSSEGSVPPRPADAFTIQRDFLPSFERTVQHYGVQLDVFYYSEALTPRTCIFLPPKNWLRDELKVQSSTSKRLAC